MIIFIIIFLIVPFTIVNYVVYGNYLEDNKENNEFLDQLLETCILNQLNPTILSCKNSYFISNVPLPIFGKYYIQYKGRISRWSKMHKKIESKFKELCGQ